MNTKKVLLGLFAGLAAGATLGMLFSPDKGNNTRNKISKKGEDLLCEMDSKFSEIAKMFMQKFESFKKSDYLNDSKSEIKHVISESADGLKSKIQ